MIKMLFLQFLTFFAFIVSVGAAQFNTVVFDFGGVIALANTEKMGAFLMTSLSIDKTELKEVLKNMQQAVLDGITEKEFWQNYSKSKNLALTKGWHALFEKIIDSSICEIPGMSSLVSELKDLGIKTAMLSDVTRYQAVVIKRRGLYKPFYPLLLSCETGFEKSDPRAFTNLLKVLDQQPSEIIFIDDKIENIEAAKKIGITALHFCSVKQLRKDLVHLGVNVESD